MVIEGFDEICSTVFIARKLFAMGKYELVEKCFFDTVDFDTYYEDMYLLMENLFGWYDSWYYGRQNMEMYVMSDSVIADFYVLAGKFGRNYNIQEENNPYLKEAQKQVQKRLNFSYCLDWKLMGHTEPKRPFHSRLAVFVYLDDWVDIGCLVYGLIEIYEWFSDACIRLQNLLYGKQTGSVQLFREEAAAA